MSYYYSGKLTWSDIEHLKVKGKGAFLMGLPSHIYGTSLATWDHTVLPATRHKWTRSALPQSVSWYSIYLPRRDGRLSWPRQATRQCTGQGRTSDLSITSPTPYNHILPSHKLLTDIVVLSPSCARLLLLAIMTSLRHLLDKLIR